MALAAMSWIFMGRLLAVKAGGLGGTASCSRVDESSPFEREQRANRVRAARLQDECAQRKSWWQARQSACSVSTTWARAVQSPGRGQRRVEVAAQLAGVLLELRTVLQPGKGQVQVVGQQAQGLQPRHAVGQAAAVLLLGLLQQLRLPLHHLHQAVRERIAAGLQGAADHHRGDQADQQAQAQHEQVAMGVDRRRGGLAFMAGSPGVQRWVRRRRTAGAGTCTLK
jgi:hypothetical protein